MIVLTISVARASLEIRAQDLDNDKVWNDQLTFVIDHGDGETEEGNYKLPVVTTLPTNPLYGIKQVRDYFWLKFTSGEKKIKLALLMADKKAQETRQLWKMNKNEEALTAGNEAMDKLEYASQLILTSKEDADQVKQILKQIYLAGFAYRQVFEIGENSFDLDRQKYQKLINRNEEWNKEQKEQKWVWNN